MLEKDLKFLVAFRTAIADTREAPWYGVWNWVLGEVIFSRLCSESEGNRTTITYPQHPLPRNIDTSEDYIQPPSLDNNSDFVMSDAADEDIRSNPPSTPIPTSRNRESTAPSPPDWKVRRADIEMMGQIIGYSPEPLSTPIPSPRHSSRPGSPRKSKRSTRIPDFAEILHEFLEDVDIVRKHLLLLVENKKLPLGSAEDEEIDFIDVLEQTEEQATHAFLSSDNSHINTIGVIVALGHYWRYVEYERREILPTDGAQHRSFSEATYTDREPSVQQRYAELDSVNTFYDERLRCCALGTDQSNAALLAVRERMRELAAMY